MSRKPATVKIAAMMEIFDIIQKSKPKETFSKDEVREMLMGIKDGKETLESSLEKI